MRVDPMTFEVVNNVLPGVAGQTAAAIRRNLMSSTGG